MSTSNHFFLSPSLSLFLSLCLPLLVIRIMENGAVNMMRSQNISIVFGPTLLRAEGDPFEMAKLTPIQNGIVELMLTEYDKIFTRKY